MALRGAPPPQMHAKEALAEQQSAAMERRYNQLVAEHAKVETEAE